MAIVNKKPYELLVKQIANELGNFIFYNRISAHYEMKNWKGFAKYFRDAANEEKEHADKIMDYLYKKQYVFNIPMPIERQMPGDMTDIGIAEARLKLEEDTTDEWYAIYESAKGRYGVQSKNGKNVYGELDKCEPSVVETIATEFIKIQDTEEEEANNFISKVRMSSNILILDKELQG